MAAETEAVTLMEPMLPSAASSELEDLAVELVASASGLAAALHPRVRRSAGDLVRSINCYYSNLIEGHQTHPRDIDRALHSDYSSVPQKRALQLEAVAHIEVQRRIDEGADPEADPTSREYVEWLHREFCARLPDELLWVENPETGERLRVEPGELRQRDVAVDRHIPPHADHVPAFLGRFEERYRSDVLSKLWRIVATAAAHHRLLWIHPFLDGNGRVARLMSHAMLKRAGVGSSLWSVSRGLARRVGDYKALLMAADEPRGSDLDGRGSLSESALVDFCKFFLSTCIDQIEYMNSLLQPSQLLDRIERYVEDEIRAGRLPRGSFQLLREAVLTGELERGRAADLTGYSERAARTILSALTHIGILVSDSPRGPVRLAFPAPIVERWFPNLYPTV